MRNAVKIFALLGIATLAYHQFFAWRHAEPAYSELRVVLTDDRSSRSAEIVLVGKRPATIDCETAKSWFMNAIAICDGQSHCRLKSNTCLDSLEPRYKKMFQKQPVSTHYFTAANSWNRRELVAVFWGLNDREAEKVCQRVLENHREKYKDDPRFSAACI